MSEEYKEQMSLMARLFYFDEEQFQKRYQRRDSVYSYFKNMLGILKNVNILALDSLLANKICQVSEMLAFTYPRDSSIQALRKELFREIHKQRLLISENVVSEIIERERKNRNVPPDIPLEKIHILEMYRLDFQNYVNIYYQTLVSEDINLFYYLSTVHKICHDYPECILDIKHSILYTIFKIQNESWYPDEILRYADATIQRVSSKNQKVKAKIIEFPKKD